MQLPPENGAPRTAIDEAVQITDADAATRCEWGFDLQIGKNINLKGSGCLAHRRGL
jgi:hypothetical protein